MNALLLARDERLHAGTEHNLASAGRGALGLIGFGILDTARNVANGLSCALGRATLLSRLDPALADDAGRARRREIVLSASMETLVSGEE